MALVLIKQTVGHSDRILLFKYSLKNYKYYFYWKCLGALRNKQPKGRITTRDIDYENNTELDTKTANQ